MAYFEPSIDAAGVHIPTYQDILDDLIASYKSIFGDDVYIGEETKDYQLLSVFAKCLDDYAALLVDVYNSRNPNYAEGDSLDLLLPLVSMKRRQATKSTVVLKLTGTPNAVLSEGLIAIDEAGYLWNLDSGVTLNSGGIAEVGATCDVAGAIAAPIGSINKIYTPYMGWEAVTNEAAADVGLNTETDDELRLRRKQSVNLQNNGSYDAIVRSLLNLDVNGDVVTFVNVLVNDTGSTDANGIPAHRVCCVVDGLDDYDDVVAEAIWKAKAPGIGTYGGPAGDYSKAITYVDEYGHANVVNFARPYKSEVMVVVNLNTTVAYDEDRVEPMIKQAIVDAINKLGIGNPWGVTTAYRDVYNAFAGEMCPFVVSSITGKTSSMGSASSVEVPVTFNEMLIADISDVTIVAT